MNVYFPITQALGNHADIIMKALNSRSEQMKLHLDAQSLFKKIAIIALKALGLASGVIAIASIPVTALMFTLTPLTIGGIALCNAVSCLAIHMLLDARSPGEQIIRDQWKAVFNALKKGKGKEIIETCQELAKQKEKRGSLFDQCLNSLPVSEVTPFFHKTCLIGYLQIALEHVRNGKETEAKSNAHMALSHFDASGFSGEIENFVRAITESPKQMHNLLHTHKVGEDLHALDYLISLKNAK